MDWAAWMVIAWGVDASLALTRAVCLTPWMVAEDWLRAEAGVNPAGAGTVLVGVEVIY